MLVVLFCSCAEQKESTPMPLDSKVETKPIKQPLPVGSVVEIFEGKRTYAPASHQPQYLKLALIAIEGDDQVGLDALRNQGHFGFVPNFTVVQIDEIEDQLAHVHSIKGKTIGQAFWIELRNLRKIQP